MNFSFTTTMIYLLSASWSFVFISSFTTSSYISSTSFRSRSIIIDNDNNYQYHHRYHNEIRKPTVFVFAEQNKNEVDVSDLGLTMDDLNKPLPPQLLKTIATTGYESTSRIPSVEDDACMWTESPNAIKARLTIPGLRGQPPMCLSMITSNTTLSIAAFGRVVWSCALRGRVKAETAVFEAKEGLDMIPIIEFEVEKENDLDSGGREENQRWGGFILQIGEDSIL